MSQTITTTQARTEYLLIKRYPTAVQKWLHCVAGLHAATHAKACQEIGLSVATALEPNFRIKNREIVHDESLTPVMDVVLELHIHKRDVYDTRIRPDPDHQPQLSSGNNKAILQYFNVLCVGKKVSRSLTLHAEKRGRLDSYCTYRRHEIKHAPWTDFQFSKLE